VRWGFRLAHTGRCDRSAQGYALQPILAKRRPAILAGGGIRRVGFRIPSFPNTRSSHREHQVGAERSTHWLAIEELAPVQGPDWAAARRFDSVRNLALFDHAIRTYGESAQESGRYRSRRPAKDVSLCARRPPGYSGVPNRRPASVTFHASIPQLGGLPPTPENWARVGTLARGIKGRVSAGRTGVESNSRWV
jgi:hypothetical protein